MRRCRASVVVACGLVAASTAVLIQPPSVRVPSIEAASIEARSIEAPTIEAPSNQAPLVLVPLVNAPLVKVARAQDAPSTSKLPVRNVVVARDPVTRVLHATFSFRGVADGEVQRKLQSGLTTVIVVAGGVFEAGAANQAVVGTGVWQSCRVTFDVWNEVYRLQISRADGVRNVVAVNLEGVLRRCTEVHEIPVQGVLAVGNTYYLAVTAEVNPVSQEMLEQIRRWVSRPPSSSSPLPGDSLFGSFVGLFVARIGKADRTVSFRTQAFVVPP